MCVYYRKMKVLTKDDSLTQTQLKSEAVAVKSKVRRSF